MDWDRVRTHWQSRPVTGTDRLTHESGRLGRLWQRVQWRDGLETGIAVLMSLFFAAVAWWLLTEAMFIPAGFALWLVLVCVYIPLRLSWTRRLIPEADPDQPVIDFLRAERRALLGQRDILASVARWYWGPVAVGAIGFYVSIRGWHWSSAAYVAVVLAVSVIIEYANRTAVRRNIEPALEEIDEQIRKMEEDDAD